MHANKLLIATGGVPPDGGRLWYTARAVSTARRP